MPADVRSGKLVPERKARDTYGVSVDDFYAYMPGHAYIFAPTRELWPAASVNARLPPMPFTDADGRPIGAKTVKANLWIDRHRPVEQMTWAPGQPMIVPGRLVSDGGWIPRPGCSTFNLYLEPRIDLGDPAQATRWVDHVHWV